VRVSEAPVTALLQGTGCSPSTCFLVLDFSGDNDGPSAAASECWTHTGHMRIQILPSTMDSQRGLTTGGTVQTDKSTPSAF
jgi:hypothetical protein